ncbi:hypothetical protein N24_2909 [Corynebacterium suranareeae]|uniref:Uncharacterized protein n=1 Tax=Corynebacterium suranareeae TaxID=2506452 RepID=A0A169S5J7_9CORY|nr:hypothetical protein [Corynebacterium suranareeae]BAU97171.1 hypothetical protein N24_2909 [Corynebacterium suranareeae]
MKEEIQRKAFVKALIVFLMGVLTGMYIGIMHSSALSAIGFIFAGLALAALVYVVNRPRRIETRSTESRNPRLD